MGEINTHEEGCAPPPQDGSAGAAQMDVMLAYPRGFCAGVVRAIEIVQSALALFGPPLYVLHEIVHNQRVIKDLQAMGTIFVETLDEVPAGAITIFSAHGVATATVEEARNKGLKIIDATCPLVTKVHQEVARHARAGRDMVLIGHAGHAEVNGSLGRYTGSYGGQIHLIQRVEDVARLEVRNPEELAFVTQTTLSVDDTIQIIAALHRRFPNIAGPRKDDICYATQNRQNAVHRLAAQVDLLLVVGSRNSSNSNRLREVGEQEGLESYLVEDADALDRAWFRPGLRVGVTAGASAPEVLVHDVLARLRSFAEIHITEMEAEPETIVFPLPAALATKLAAKNSKPASGK